MSAANSDSLKEYIDARSVAEPNSGCWLWLLSDGSHGYPQGCWEKRVSLAHRLSYLAHKGEIPDGYDVDHLCRNRSCVNPDHLEAVTQFANRARQNGARVSADHTIADGCSMCGGELAVVSGRTVCRACHSRRNAKYRAKLK